MKKLNKKSSAEAEGLTSIGETLIWIAIAVVCGIAVYLLINKISTGI